MMAEGVGHDSHVHPMFSWATPWGAGTTGTGARRPDETVQGAANLVPKVKRSSALFDRRVLLRPKVTQVVTK